MGISIQFYSIRIDKTIRVPKKTDTLWHINVRMLALQVLLQLKVSTSLLSISAWCFIFLFTSSVPKPGNQSSKQAKVVIFQAFRHIF